MTGSTLDELQRLVDQLSPKEQVSLLIYLALRMSQTVMLTSHPAIVTSQEGAGAWDEFFRLGDALAASDTPGSESMTATVLAMRR